MLPPLNRDELALLKQPDFLRHVTAVDARIVDMLPTDPKQSHLLTNNLGEANHELISALEQFLASDAPPAAKRTARALILKLRSAFQAARRP